MQQSAELPKYTVTHYTLYDHYGQRDKNNNEKEQIGELITRESFDCQNIISLHVNVKTPFHLISRESLKYRYLGIYISYIISSKYLLFHTLPIHYGTTVNTSYITCNVKLCILVIF